MIILEPCYKFSKQHTTVDTVLFQYEMAFLSYVLRFPRTYLKLVQTDVEGGHDGGVTPEGHDVNRLHQGLPHKTEGSVKTILHQLSSLR